MFVAIFAIMVNIVPAMATEPIKVFINNQEIIFDVPPFVENSRVLVPIRKIAETLAFNVNWIDGLGQIVINGHLYNENIVLSVGEGYAEINGHKIPLDAPAVIKEGRTFIPIRFISEALGGTVRWYELDNAVSITSDLLHASVDEHLFWFNKANGKLFYAYGNASPKKLIDLDWEPKWESVAFFTAEATPAGNVLLTLKESYGEPRIFEGIHSIYFNLANYTLHHSSVAYASRPSGNVKFFQDKVVLTDGKKVFVIDDNTGEIMASYDLPAMIGQEDIYYVEGIGDNYLLIRPSETGLLTLLYLDTGERVLLYKELLDDMQQEYAEMNDVPYRGDWLKLVGQEDNILYFKNEASVFGQDETIYIYEVK